MSIIVHRHLIWEGRTRTNEAHVAFNHVHELRQFIQAGFAQYSSQTCRARIIVQLEPCAVAVSVRTSFTKVTEIGFMNRLVCILYHRSKFVERKRANEPYQTTAFDSPPGPYTVLYEQHWTWGFELDQNGDHQHQRKEDNKQPARQEDVNGTLAPEVHAPSVSPLHSHRIDGQGRRCNEGTFSVARVCGNNGSEARVSPAQDPDFAALKLSSFQPVARLGVHRVCKGSFG